MSAEVREAREKALQLFLVDREVQVLKGAIVLDAYATAVRAELLAKVKVLVEAEEEADGPMPDAFWTLFRAAAGGPNRDKATEIVRGTISATKRSILARLTTLEALNGPR